MLRISELLRLALKSNFKFGINAKKPKQKTNYLGG